MPEETPTPKEPPGKESIPMTYNDWCRREARREAARAAYSEAGTKARIARGLDPVGISNS